MKKLVLYTLLSLGFLNVASSAIPTIDTNSIAQFNTIKSQLEEARKQVDEFKKEALEMQKRLEGFTNFDQILKDEFSSLIDDFVREVDDAVLQQFKALADLETVTGSGADEVVKDYATKHQNIEAEMKRLDEKEKQLRRLREQFEGATTPQKREELSNTISAEQMNIELGLKKAELEKEKIETETKAKEMARDRSTLNKMLYGTSTKE